MQGRFTSPDPYVIFFETKIRGGEAEEQDEMLVEYISQPQNWSSFSYGLNNPLSHTDPTGMRPPNKYEQAALDRLDELAAQESDPDLRNGLRAARAEIAKIIDGLGKGKSNIGVNIAVNAILNIGNQAFADSATIEIRDHNGVGIKIGPSNKCNVLVASTFVQGAGLNWLKNGRGYPLMNGAAPAANWLGDARNRQHLANLAIVHGRLRPGDIVAWRYSGGKDDGHSSIYIGGGVVVYAGGPSVNNWAAGTPQAQTLDYVNSRLTSFLYTWRTGSHEARVARRYNGKP